MTFIGLFIFLPEFSQMETPPEQPFSLKAALKFGFIFLVLSVEGILAQRSLGVFGFYAVSRAGGLLSSASAVAAAGIAFGVFGVLVHKTLETAFQSVLPIRNTPAANTH